MHCGSVKYGRIVVLVCHVISQDHVMWRYGQKPIKVSYQPAKFGGHKHSGSGDMLSVYNVILR